MHFYSTARFNKTNPYNIKLEKKKGSSIKPHVLNFLHELNEHDSEFEFRDIRTCRRTVLTEVYCYKEKYNHNYLDDIVHVRRFCQCMAEDLRDLTGKSVYFDLVKGKLAIIT